ncbi:gametocyte-specific factor 1 homolog [Musca vetustissima]|uniref:gametocyte-specific factor 1 homolog n=1 Tax=Musca vetustissima TaxID=27455 RepID=UPI002AB62B60|nr:gametocyte-specific factor 1 homolog [Musca vetustissima]
MENVHMQDIMECPYEKHHQILRSRMQVHLTRCRKNHTNVKKVTCPFNVTHILNEPELEFHISSCPGRTSFEHFRNTVEVPISRTVPPPMPKYESEENWDDENVPSYNPQAYAANADVLRSIQGAPPSQRKAFRKQERLRLLGIDNN